MHKDGNCKEVLRKFRQQWGNFTDEEIAKMQETYEEHERMVIQKFKFPKDDCRLEN